MEEWIPQQGDIVTITKSRYNWSDETMDCYVGKRYMISYVHNDNLVKFSGCLNEKMTEDELFELNAWTWRKSDNHFKLFKLGNKKTFKLNLKKTYAQIQ